MGETELLCTGFCDLLRFLADATAPPRASPGTGSPSLCRRLCVSPLDPGSLSPSLLTEHRPERGDMGRVSLLSLTDAPISKCAHKIAHVLVSQPGGHRLPLSPGEVLPRARTKPWTERGTTTSTPRDLSSAPGVLSPRPTTS